MSKRVTLAAMAGLCALMQARAQAPAPAPVVSIRGVTNAFTRQPAPSAAAPGGLIWIDGLNLGPAGGLRPTALPLPTSLGDPAIQVLIGGRAAPIVSVSPSRIVAQIPWEANPGLTRVTVARGEMRSRPARIMIANPLPSVRTRDDAGFGEAHGVHAGSAFKFAATGLGVTEPRVASGDAGSKDPPATPRTPIRAYVGGLPARVTASLAPDRVGEFDVEVELPSAARQGDVVTLVAGNRPANRTTFGRALSAEVQYLALPEGTPTLRSLISSDLRGDYLMASGAREDTGCYQSVLFDLGRQTARPVEGCLTSANRNAASPIVTTNEGAPLAALVGPAEGEPDTGISSKVRIFHPAQEEPADVTLPAPASALVGAGGNFVAVAPGTPPSLFSINALTGEISEAAGGVPGAGGGGAGGLNALALNLQIDAGDGVTHVLSPPVQLGQGVLAVVAGDDQNQPTIAKVALVNSQGELTNTRAFPEGWLPLVGPLPQAAGGAPGGGGGAPGGGGRPGGGGAPGGGAGPQPGSGGPAQAPLARFRVSLSFDPEARGLYVLSKKTDNSAHGLIFFAGDGSARPVPFPDSWFVASCTPVSRMFNLELSRRLAILGARNPETESRNPCPAQGFLLLDLETQTVSAIALPGQGQFNAAANTGDVNDYIFGTNTDASRRGISDTLFVLDGVTGSSFRLDLPSGVTGFANVIPVPAIGSLVALATNRAPGDAGLVVFDLEAESTKMLPTPEGFANITLVGVFNSTRKLVARGIKPENGGSQLLIYDLRTGDLTIPANPDGVMWVGSAPGTPGAPNLLRANEKANIVYAVGYGEDRRQAGVLAIRVP